ncbi:UNVERIFIED_CONTAM: hypothetical protein GTU68_005485 [Idotea baltica]|nr:hypothetical protein [Idotea baltica]
MQKPNVEHLEHSVESEDALFGRDEERLHFATHFAGVLFVVLFGWRLWSAPGLTPNLQLGIGIYLVTFFVVFLASSFYHLTVLDRHRRLLRKLDHISIYFFIAGSNTPYLLGYGDDTGIVFLCLMWGLVLFGTIIKWFEIHLSEWLSLVFYLFLGWLGIVTVYLILDSLSLASIFLVVLGGVLYSVGAYFYRHDTIKWYHGIWHLFVLAAAGCHFLAIYWQVQ